MSLFIFYVQYVDYIVYIWFAGVHVIGFCSSRTNIWDNRVTAHSALLDWDDGARRHLARITPQAEAPYEDSFEG